MAQLLWDAKLNMDVTLKLYASLGVYLPDHALKNEAVVSAEDGTNVEALIDQFNVPREECHLVLVNGVFKAPSQRSQTVLKAGDAVAVWPPVAGG